MALKSKTNEIEEAPVVEQVTFDDIEFEAEYIDEDEMSVKKYYTISGKEQEYEPEWDKYNIRELDVGDEFSGKPEITIFENEDKTYDALRLRIMDDGEILDCYINYPKKHFPFVRGITKGFDFYRNCFDFIYSVLKYRDERNVVDANGEEYNKFSKINLEMLAKYVDQHERIRVEVTERKADGDFTNVFWKITKLE